jgi:hypothetical protein
MTTNRITNRDLEGVVGRINRTTGQPETPYTKKKGKLLANIGNYHLDWAYGGVKLVQMMSLGGGIRVISNGGYGTKRELYNEMQTFLRGIEIAQEEK